MTTLVTATALALCVVLAGCSSSSGSDASTPKGDKTTTTAGTSDTTKSDDTTKPDDTKPGTTVPIKIDPSLSIDAAATKALENIDTSDFCAGVEGFAGLFQALFNGFGSDAERPEATPAEEAAFNKAVKAWGAKMLRVAPADLKDDFALFADDPMGENAEATPAQKKASDNVEAYVKSHCNLPSSPS